MTWKTLALVVALAACAQTSASPSSAAAPAAAPPPAGTGALAAFAGTWNGTWNGKLDTTLIVDPVTPTTARVIYEWGIATEWQINNPGFVRVTAQFDGNLLVAHVPQGTVGFILQPDGTLHGELAEIHPTSSGPVRAILTKQ
jgi:hypothetical protein